MDFSSVITVGLVGVSLVVAFEYYRLLRKAQKEYDKAKTSLDDIVLSFNRQVEQVSKGLESTLYRVEGLTSKSEGASRKADDAIKTVQSVDNRIGTFLEKGEQTLTSVGEVGKRVGANIASQESLIARVSGLEEKVGQLSVLPEAGVEPVIPIRRDKALAPLTVTEVSVLEMLVAEGAKTAPEIKQRVNLSREHTARLMKKLYESGYLERETNKIPFRYSVKKEMEKLLRKTEPSPA
jgi:DNA-binding Lrp family transcriptional regulator